MYADQPRRDRVRDLTAAMEIFPRSAIVPGSWPVGNLIVPPLPQGNGRRGGVARVKGGCGRTGERWLLCVGCWLLCELLCEGSICP